MSRRKTKPEEIIDREHYFNRYLAKEALHEHIEQNKYESMNSSLEQMLEKDNNSNVRRKILLHATNRNGEEFEEYLSRQSCENWLECISDVQLHKALKQLTKKQQAILYYRYYYQLSQRETAEILQCTQQLVSKQEYSAKRKIKKLLKRGCEK